MPHFAYSALDSRGKKQKGRLEAPSISAAVNRLRVMGMTPFEISLAAQDNTGKSAAFGQPLWKKRISFSRGVPKASVAALVRQLATLLQAGLPLDRALSAIYSSDEVSPLSRIVATLHETILGGKDLANGLSAYPSVFSKTFIAMIHAGEASGTLALVMERLASHLEQEEAMRRKIRSALAYPVLMFVVGVAVVIFLLSFVIPQVTRIFADMGRELPLPTRMLLAVSDGFRNWWWLLVLCLLCCILFLWRMLKTEKGKRMFHSLLFSVPLGGAVYARAQLGNFARTLGMLLKNGVPLLSALQIARSASSNIKIMESVQSMIDGVQAGRDLSSVMTDTAIYPAIARQMVAAGEKSGRLAEMLLWVADDAESNVAARLQTLTSLLEPIMILVLGGLVGFVVIAIILPIFEMSSLAG